MTEISIKLEKNYPNHDTDKEEKVNQEVDTTSKMDERLKTGITNSTQLIE